MSYTSGSHTVFHHRYHIVWITKYRYRVLEGALRERIRTIIRQVCRELSVQIVSGVLSREHVHMFVEIPPHIAVSDFVRCVKGRSSHRVQMEFPDLRKRYWGRHFWARATSRPKLVTTVGRQARAHVFSSKADARPNKAAEMAHDYQQGPSERRNLKTTPSKWQARVEPDQHLAHKSKRADIVLVVAVAAVLVVASGIGAADAQQGMPGMMQGGGMPMGHEDMMGPGMMMCRTAEHVEGRLAYLKTELKITEAQMPQWNAIADAFRATGQKMAQHCAMATAR